MTNNSLEIEDFKTLINLSEYLASKGFELDRKKSCQAYAVMRKDDLKFVVTRAADGHYVYTDAKNPKNCGTVIDACQSLTGKNLGKVRQELRPWIGAQHSRPQVKKYQSKIKKTEVDFPKIISAWENARPVQRGYDYFRSRHLNDETIQAYQKNIRESLKGTVLFRHFTAESPAISGFEFKSEAYSGFSKGGQKGLCVFRLCDPVDLEKIVITETALDALSKAQLDGLPRNRAYVSLGGNPSTEQLKLLEAVVRRFELEPVVATDNDRGGDVIYDRIVDVLGECERLVPQQKDWNSDLEQDALEQAQQDDLEQDDGLRLR